MISIPVAPISRNDLDDFSEFTNNMHNDKQYNVLVIGDIMLDYFMHCTLSKTHSTDRHNISCTGDFIYDPEGSPELYMPGGAARIAAACSNFANVYMLGIIGEDWQGKQLSTVLEKWGVKPVLFEIKNYLTVTKHYIKVKDYGERGSSEGFIPYRVNRELDTKSSEKLIIPKKLEILNELKKIINEMDCVILKDNEKGLFSDELANDIISIINDKKEASEKPFYVFLDPKYSWTKFENLKIDAIFPNIKETASGINLSNWDYVKGSAKSQNIPDEDCIKLKEHDNINHFIIKMGENGAKLIGKTENIIKSIDKYDCKLKNCGEEIGCGDIFDAYFIGCMLSNFSDQLTDQTNVNYEKCLRYATYVAGIQYKLTSERIIGKNDIEEELSRIKEKIFDIVEEDICSKEIRKPIRIGLVQLEYDLEKSKDPFAYSIKQDQIKSQLIKIETAITKSISENVNIICLPELSLHESFITGILNKLENKDVILIGGSYYKDRFNICPIIYGNKVIEYKKISPSPFEMHINNDRGMKPGHEIIVIKSHFGNFVVLTCCDFTNYHNQIIQELGSKIKLNFIINPCYDESKENLRKSYNTALYISNNFNIDTIFINSFFKEHKPYLSGVVGKIHYGIGRDEESGNTNMDNLIGAISKEALIIGDFYYNNQIIVADTNPHPPFSNIHHYLFDSNKQRWFKDK
ncbi:PfkB family carbohydrate kinase [Methanosarcina hadiensis]|uniref:PfkB family carbohydrate kinase n=1 Tax=Methanosarcina hadiensis TaxID=3078083 RepID=UPI0039772DF8